MEMKRSKYLVHWTGKEIQLRVDELNEEQRTNYTSRLFSILRKGFWMTKPTETIHGHGGGLLKYEAPMTCFTEMKLSAAKSHALQYGLLGIGVLRQFVLDRFGGPVHYVRNREDETIVGNIGPVLELLKTQEAGGQISPKKHYRSGLTVIAAFFKRMSTEGETEDFVFLDEQEWRIVHTYLVEQQDLIDRTGESEPMYRIPLEPTDVKFIVFPDDETRALSYRDSRFREWSEPLKVPPTMVTLEECDHF